ncbi:hypothetical protein BU23DRAFT_552531, partial [Bimuria novae-zelandiae CBS 107.79]
DYSDDGDDDWDENSKKEEGTKARGKLRLLSLRDKQGIEWKDICERFPNRTEDAVKMRYYRSQKKQKREETSIRT